MSEKDDQLHKGHRQRLRQSFIDKGNLTGFYEHNVLELLLFYSIPRRDVNPLAHRLINHFGSLYNVLNADHGELVKAGISDSSAALIKLVSEIPKYAERSRYQNRKFKNLDETMKFAFNMLSKFNVEMACVMCLNIEHKLTHYEIIGIGTPKKAYIPVRRIIEIAITHSAAEIIIAHNHPSGNCKPSQSDIEGTDRLRSFLNTIDSTLVEHIIVGYPACYGIINGYTYCNAAKIDDVDNLDEK